MLMKWITVSNEKFVVEPETHYHIYFRWKKISNEHLNFVL